MTHFNFTSTELIEKGWSDDKKFKVTTADGQTCLLRLSAIGRYDERKALFDLLGEVAALGIPMCRPVEFGECSNGVYTLHTWIDGCDALDVIPLMPKDEQYRLGKRSGEILGRIHSIPAPDTQEDWYSRFNRKTDIKIKRFEECPIKFEGSEHIIEYIENNRELLRDRPQCFQHGDYHIGNMMMERGELVIIDFDRFDFGDPWEEFNRIVWCAQACPHFATGQLDGYFGDTPPLDFFRLLAFYISSNTISSIYWAVPYGEAQIETMMKQSQEVLSWYDNMRSVVPNWYRDCSDGLRRKM